MMYLENKTAKLVEEAKELMDLCIKQMDVDDIKNMDSASLDAIQKCIKLVDHACELAVEQATVIDSMNEKMDRILDILQKAEKDS